MTELSNQLSTESSPYLQLHREHKVAWQAWNEQTLSLARLLKKPILLSIGYSACHWCHVMARESFADAQIAELMNQHFLNVKVDREERPDLDEVYQTAHQMLTGKPGGWPLTLFLCPETQLPFLAGTYFPKDGQGGVLGFEDLLRRVSTYYRDQQQDFTRLRAQVADGFQQLMSPVTAAPAMAAKSFLPQALECLKASQDSADGGFGAAPKFPLPVNVSVLLRAEASNQLSVEQAEHLHLTLTAMAERGINDRIGGGFFRYSVDDHWTIPHFEKMLYDNGLLLDVYARAWILSDDPLHKSAAIGVVRWLRQHMLSPSGVFYSSMSAETEGREGDYYCLALGEIKGCLSDEEFSLFELMFSLRGEANFGEQWHLSQRVDLASAARKLMLTRENALQLYRSAREKIETLRYQKPRPLVDNKILTSWNALVIKGLFCLARKDDEQRELNLAHQAVNFIRDKLFVGQRLFAAWQNDQPSRHGFLDDYAYLMDALLEGLQTHWRDVDYEFLIALAEALLRAHEDVEHGGLFYSGHDAQRLIYRSKPLMDTALPSANGVAARVLWRLGNLAAEPRYLNAARAIVASAQPAMQQSPETHLTLIQVHHEMLSPLPQVFLLDAGDRLASWQRDIRQTFPETVMCYRVPANSVSLPPEMLALEPLSAVVCSGDRCLAPQSTRIAVIDQLTELVSEMAFELSP
ncbi:MAG: thioredoxin domain-containing protein [Cellvibrionaceae bacterium]